jgi:hypothetical protein
VTGRPKNEPRRELEQKWGVSARQVQRIIKENGWDQVKDETELRKKERMITMAFKTIRLEREQHELELKRRDVIPKVHAEAWAAGFAVILNQSDGEALTNWPTEMAGKNEIEHRELLTKAFDERDEQIRKHAASL